MAHAYETETMLHVGAALEAREKRLIQERPFDSFQFGLMYLYWVNIDTDHTAKVLVRGK